MDRDGNCEECKELTQTICPLCGNLIIICSNPEQCGAIEQGLHNLIKLNIKNK